MSFESHFLAALAADLPQNERMIVTGFRGDPNAQQPSAWRPRPWKPGQIFPLDPPDNAYVTVASFGQTADRTFRRRKEAFAAGRALLIDDVGTKVARSVVQSLRPTAIIETSPGNEQWWYFLSKPERNVALFDGVIRAFIKGKLAGDDPGMSGVTRVGRLPGFTNGKPAYGGKFKTVLRDFDPSRRFTINQLLSAFDIKLEGLRYSVPLPPKSILKDRASAYFVVEKFLRDHGMLKRHEPDLSGWIEMTCPWKDDHTGGVNNGAAIRMPNVDNQFFGAFKCWHGHCEARGWQDLTQWVEDLALEELEIANSSSQ